MKSLRLFILSVFLAAPAFAQTNIVFILVDDMGYADLSCYGAPDAKTPRIDELAAQGVKFTQMYAMGTECTPSRTAILTGRYPQRVGGLECAIGTGNVGRYDDAIELAGQNDLGLPPDHAELAPGLKEAGFATAVFGKWHLGYEPKFNPLNQGFDRFKGFLGGNVEYFQHVELSDLEVVLDGLKPVKRKGYMTHVITGDALEFLDEQSKNRPFFLYVPYSTPHFPFQAPGDDTGKLPTEEEWTQGTRQTYVKMLEDMDANVGRILDALKKKNLDENTLVVFASDHGAMKPGLNDPFRDYKGTLFEGGIRVPCIARWPGHLEPGTVSEQTASLMDLTKSFLRIGGAEVPEDLDGIDILRVTEAGVPPAPRTLFWRAKRGDRTWWAVRDGDMKYVRKQEGNEEQEWMFDLASDPGEQTNLTEEDKPKRNELRNQLQSWEREVQPQRP